MTKRTAVVDENGYIVNIIVADPNFDKLPGYALIEAPENIDPGIFKWNGIEFIKIEENT